NATDAGSSCCIATIPDRSDDRAAASNLKCWLQAGNLDFLVARQHVRWRDNWCLVIGWPHCHLPWGHHGRWLHIHVFEPLAGLVAPSCGGLTQHMQKISPLTIVMARSVMMKAAARPSGAASDGHEGDQRTADWGRRSGQS